MRQKIVRSKSYEMVKQWKKERNVIVQQIKYQLKRAYVKWSDYLINEIEKNKNNKKFFEAQRKLNSKKRSTFYLINSDGYIISNTFQLLKITTDYYRNLFDKIDKSANELSPWIGFPRPLLKSIMALEVEIAIYKMHNGRSPGKDGIQTELIKYGGASLYQCIAKLNLTKFLNYINQIVI